MDQLGIRKLLTDQSGDLGPWVVIGRALLDQFNRIALSILRFEVVRGTKDDKTAVNHDCKTITELLSFIHAMRC